MALFSAAPQTNPTSVVQAPQLPKGVQQAVERLVAQFAPVCVYLFGSQAQGDATPASDYDLLVVIPASHPVASWSGFKRDRLAYRALVGISMPKDVLVWTEHEFEARRHWPASLPATVVREGCVLYERQPHAA